MAVSQVNNVKPSIIVKVSPGLDATNEFKNVLFGIEEEGIPYTVEVVQDAMPNTKNLSYEACNKSNLGVGVGIADDGVSVHFEKLNKDESLFCIDISSDLEKLRDIGSNAARVVKKMPFKAL